MTNLIRMLSIVLILFCPLSMAASVQVGTHKTQNVSVIYGVAQKPGEWIFISDIDLPRLDLNTTSMCTSSELCLYGETKLGHNGKARIVLWVDTPYQVITDAEGRKFEFKVAYPHGGPIIGINEINHRGGNTWKTNFTMSANSATLPSESDTTISSNGFIRAQGYCGSPQGCQYGFASYFHSSSPKPGLYVKLPENIKSGDLTFTDVPVLKFRIKVNNAAENDPAIPEPRELRISGRISIPQRCYISLEGSDTLNFGSIFTNRDNGLIQQHTGTILTYCKNAPQKTRQYLKVEGVSGGTLSNDNYVYEFERDNMAKRALGFVFRIGNAPECNPSQDNRNRFNKEYDNGYISAGSYVERRDKINIGLCKYGIPISEGNRQVAIKITSRWVKE
ncbi:hypothetical protein ACGXZQ_004172 [Escherichia albertii]